MTLPPATTSRLGELSEPIASTREYDLCTQSVRVDATTSETMYSVVHRGNGVCEGRYATFPAGLGAMMALEDSLNQTRIAAAQKVTFHV